MTDSLQILCIHPQDETTDFLRPIGELFGDNYIVIPTRDESHQEIINRISLASESSLIIFLGHGTQSLLYGAEGINYEKKAFITIETSNKIFINKNILFVSCLSSDFLNKSNVYYSAIGFGNIISSIKERNDEAELITGIYRQVNKEGIDLFNICYVNSIKQSLFLLLTNNILFEELFSYIRFYLNKEINNVLLNKNNSSRTEIARLLFEFRDEMVFKKNLI